MLLYLHSKRIGILRIQAKHVAIDHNGESTQSLGDVSRFTFEQCHPCANRHHGGFNVAG